MTIAFACDQCGKKYATPAEFAGKALRCKQCGTILRIPAAPAPAKPAPKAAPARPEPPRDDLYDLDEPAPIALSAADAIESDDEIPVARPEGVRRTWGKPPASSSATGPAAIKNPKRAPKASSSEGIGAKVAGAGVGGLGVAFLILRIVLRAGNQFSNANAQAPQPPPPPIFFNNPPPGAAPAVPGAAPSLADARRNFRTNLTRRESAEQQVDPPPPGVFDLVKYESPAGSLSAYLTPDPGDGKKHPAIVWITGGDCATIGDVWSPSPPENDQSARAFREAGIAMMFPSLRGGNDNPGVHEGFLGEVDDVLAARDFLASKDYVDPARIYLGGHSSGGTAAFLAAASSDKFRAVFSFGPADSIANYPPDLTPFNTSDPREVAIRSPIQWLSSVRSPTFVIEGEGGNIAALRSMARASKNPRLHFFPIRGADHFSVLGPATRFLAGKVLRDVGPSANNLIRPGELQNAFGH